ncbi:MAG: nucleoside deaminase [Acidobacteria bacterium]|nr:nucleoside deaminase [Acidobacteriota bacterium]
MKNPYMTRAIELATGNAQSGRGGPFAAVVVKDAKILAEGTNLVTSTNDPTAHAEVVAIRKACRLLGDFQLRGCDVYTSCEPCPMCLGAIYWARPARVYFASTAGDAAAAGFDDSLIYEQLRVPFAQRRIPMIQLMREEARAAFRVWEEQPDKTFY